MNMRQTGFRFPAMALLCLLSMTAVHAQEGVVEDADSGIGLAPGLRLNPKIETQFWQTDNRYRSNSDTRRETGLIIKPELVLAYAQRAGVTQLGYSGAIETVAGEDYNDREVFLKTDLRPMLRHRFEADARYRYGHDAIGIGRTEGIPDPQDLDLDKWEDKSAAGQYTFGAPEARMNLSARAEVYGRDYTTNRDQGTGFLDYDSVSFGGNATYRIGAKTQAVIDYEHQVINFDENANPTYDNTTDRYLTGLRWQATAKTAGEVLVGYFDRDFKAAERGKSDGIDWRAKVAWTPLLRTRLTVTTGRLLRETFLVVGENFVNTRYYELSWRQMWSARLYTDVKGALYDSSYDGTSRSDDTRSGSATLNYELMRNFVVKAGVMYTDRNSTVRVSDYDRYDFYQGFEFVF